MRIRVGLADDHALVRQGLLAVLALADDIDVLWEASTGAHAVERATAVPVDVVLMDLSMPVLDGIAATHAVGALPTTPRVVVLTSFAEQDRVRAALEAGAVGYVLKDSEPRVVVDAVRAAHAGHAPLDPRIASILLPHRPQSDDEPDASGIHTEARLSPRERQVLDLVAEGLANKQIARRLGISERTVKAHLSQVFRVLAVSDRTSAALWARDNPASH